MSFHTSQARIQLRQRLNLTEQIKAVPSLVKNQLLPFVSRSIQQVKPIAQKSRFNIPAQVQATPQFVKQQVIPQVRQFVQPKVQTVRPIYNQLQQTVRTQPLIPGLGEKSPALSQVGNIYSKYINQPQLEQFKAQSKYFRGQPLNEQEKQFFREGAMQVAGTIPQGIITGKLAAASRTLSIIQQNRLISALQGIKNFNQFRPSAQIQIIQNVRSIAEETIPQIVKSKEMVKLSSKNYQQLLNSVGKFLEDRLVQAKNPSIDIGLQAKPLGKLSLPGEIGITSFRGTPVTTIAETTNYFNTPRAKGFVNSLNTTNKSFNVKVPNIHKTAGVWQGSIEPSFSVNITGSKMAIRAYAALHGYKGNQDSVALFTSKPTGMGSKYIFKNINEPDQAIQTLKNHGIDGATYNPTEKSLFIYDLDGSLNKNVIEYGRTIKSIPQIIRGNIEFIGKNDYESIIADFGKRTRRNFGINLGQRSRGISQTATTEIPPRGTIPGTYSITEPQLKVSITREIGEFIQRLGQGEELPPELLNKSQRYFKNVADLLRKGRITIDDIPSAKRAGYTNEQAVEVADLYEKAASYGGKFLNQLSQDVKSLALKFPEIKPIAQPQNLIERGYQLFKQSVGIQGAALVSNIYTALRNFYVFGSKVPMRALADAIAGGLEVTTGKATAKQAFAPLFEDFAALARILGKGEREQLFNLLKKYPLQEARFFQTPTAESIIGSKIANALTIMNRFQDRVVSTYRLDALVRSYLTRKNLQNFDQIPIRVINNFVTDAMRFSFRGQPKYQAMRSTLRTFDNPIAKLGLIRFPRFMALSMEHIFEWSPMGFSKLLFDKSAQANPRAAFEAIGEATTGSLLLALGYVLRKGDSAGDKWYQIKRENGEIIDARSYQPIAAYLFLGDILANGLENIRGKDLLEGALSINRISGTALAFIDAFRAKEPSETIQKITQNWAGQFVGGFSAPLRQLSVALSTVNPQEAIARSTREAPLTAPFVSNIPFIRQSLPEVPAITRTEPLKTEFPGQRFLGISRTKQTPFEAEMGKLDIRFEDVTPKTGEPLINRLIIKNTGPIIERITQNIATNKRYQQLTDEQKKEVIKEIFSIAKKEAKQQVFEENSTDIAQLIRKELKGEERPKQKEILKKYKNKGLLVPQVIDNLMNRQQVTQ